MMRAVVIAGVLALAATTAAPAADRDGASTAQAGQGQTPALPEQGRRAVGFTERAILYPGNLPLYAKLDSGAQTSSLNAHDIDAFERDGRLWVRFQVTNRENRTETFERPVVRYVRIKDLTGPAVSRPVIMLGICVADVFRVTEVNLADRTGFNFQLLVGRQFMRQGLLVDPGRQLTAEPRCAPTPEALRALDAIPGIRYEGAR